MKRWQRALRSQCVLRKRWLRRGEKATPAEKENKRTRAPNAFSMALDRSFVEYSETVFVVLHVTERSMVLSSTSINGRIEAFGGRGACIE